MQFSNPSQGEIETPNSVSLPHPSEGSGSTYAGELIPDSDSDAEVGDASPNMLWTSSPALTARMERRVSLNCFVSVQASCYHQRT